MTERRTRLTCEISEENHRKLDKHFQHGERKRLINIFLDKFFEQYDKYGDAIKYTYLAGDLDVLKLLKGSKKK